MSKSYKSIRSLVMAALLSAIAIAIPMYSPIKIVIPPASFTLASHVPIFFGMFLSPAIGVAVALVASLGFFLGAFPLVIVLRALTHVIFATVGGLFLRKFPKTLSNTVARLLFSFVLAIIHALMEVAVVTPLYYGGKLTQASYNAGFFLTVILLVGVGTVVHSMLDFEIATWLYKATAPVASLNVSTPAVKTED